MTIITNTAQAWTMYWRVVPGFLFSLTLAAQSVVPLKAAGPYLLVDGVYVNGHGPFRFLLDTGAEMTELSSKLAEQLALRPSYRVETVSVNGRQQALAAKISDVTLGSVRAVNIEVVWYDLTLKQRIDPSIAGVLGQSFLRRFCYWIDVANHQVSFEQDVEPATGKRLPLESVNGRPVIAWNGRRMVLDSGAPAVIMHKNPGEEGRSEDGLLPLTMFHSVYVNPRDRYVILN